MPFLRVLKKHVDNIEMSYEELEELSRAERTRLVQSNLMTCARYYDYRVHAFMNHTLDEGNMGVLKDCFYRVEFQAGGSPHIHCFVWMADAPDYGVNADKDVVTSTIE